MSLHSLIAPEESGLLVTTNTTVENDVGICHLDPIEETLVELSSIPGHVLSIQPYRKALKKYFLVINPSADPIAYVRIRPILETSNLYQDPKNFYSIKTIIAPAEPLLGTFDDLVNLNSFRIDNPTSGDIIPIWILLESKLPLNLVIGLTFEVEYEWN